jgi:hypothetical protein
VLDTLYLRRGPRQVDRRALVFWESEKPSPVPKRGVRGYRVAPIPWPDMSDEHSAWLASVPKWARRAGHPAIPEGIRSVIHERAREVGAAGFTPMADPGVEDPGEL